MEPYGAIDTVVGWIATLYMWIPILAVMIVFVGLALFNGVDFKKAMCYPLLKIKIGRASQFFVGTAE
jgi:hypothetical protein